MCLWAGFNLIAVDGPVLHTFAYLPLGAAGVSGQLVVWNPGKGNGRQRLSFNRPRKRMEWGVRKRMVGVFL